MKRKFFMCMLLFLKNYSYVKDIILFIRSIRREKYKLINIPTGFID